MRSGPCRSPRQAGGSGLGKPLKLLAKPVQERLPIYLGSIGPKAVEQVGAIADGWLPFLLNPDEPDVLMDPLRAGLDRAGRSIDDIDVAPVAPVSIHEDIDEARNLSRPWLAFYLGAMGAKAKNFYVELADRYGFGDSARECQEKMLAGDRLGAAQAISDELIDCACIATTPAGLDEKLAAYEAAGANTLVAVPRRRPRGDGARAGRRLRHGQRRLKLEQRAASAPEGIPGIAHPGPFPVGRYAKFCATSCESARGCSSMERSSTSVWGEGRRSTSSCATPPAACPARCGATTSTRSRSRRER